MSLMYQHVATLQLTAVQRKTAFGNSHDGLNLTCLDAMVFLPMALAPPQADAKELLYSLPSKFVP